MHGLQPLACYRLPRGKATMLGGCSDQFPLIRGSFPGEALEMLA